MGRHLKRGAADIIRDTDRLRSLVGFRNGVLTVTLPKTERAQAKAKRIAINGGS